MSEPTVSGLHDMERVLKLCAHFRVPKMVCINKFDLNEKMTASIEEKASEMDAQVVGKIPFDSAFTKAMVQGETLFELNHNSKTADEIRSLWGDVSRLLEKIGSQKATILSELKS